MTHGTPPVPQPSLRFSEQRLTRQQAAQYLGVSVEFLDQDAVGGRHRVPYIRVGRKVFYLLDDLDNWLVSRRVVPGVQYNDEVAANRDAALSRRCAGGDDE